MPDSVVPIWLDATAPVPVTVPFTRRQAMAAGVDPRRLSAWVESGHLLRPLRSVYHAAQLEDTLELRVACLRLVVPPDAVVTDRTAAWLLGAPMVLAPGDHLRVPQVSIFQAPGHRLRNKLAVSGERALLPDEVVEIHGLRVTTPLRTACDLGRLLHPDQAFAGMCMVMRGAAFTVGELVDHVERFRGYRGVRQLRMSAPWVDGRLESPGEAIVLFRWRRDCPDLPRPVPQVEVAAPHGGSYFLDLAVPELLYAAEYDGPEWHGPERLQHDRERRAFVAGNDGYLIDVLTADNLRSPHSDVDRVLRAGIVEARRRFGRRAA